MNFTLRTSLFVVTIISLWLGALLSQNGLLLELAKGMSFLMIFLALPLAIWDANKARRPFWAGFFAVGLGNLLLLINSFDYNNLSTLVASAFVRSTPVAASPVQPNPAWTFTTATYPPPARYATLATPGSPGSPQGFTILPVTTPTGMVSNPYMIQQSVPIALTLFFAMVGGIITSRMSLASAGIPPHRDASPGGIAETTIKQ